MSKTKDYIPRGFAHYNDWFKNLTQYVSAKCSGANPQWDHIPQEARDELDAAYIDWYTYYSLTVKPCTKAARTDRNLARKRSEKVVRQFVKRYLRFPPVTDADRVNMQINNYDTTSTTINDPLGQVSGELRFPGIHMIEVAKIMPVNGPSQDIRSDYGVKIFYGFTGKPTTIYPFRLSEPPQSGNELPYSKFTRKKKAVFNFDGESGNTVYFCLRYENQTGGEGPFGPVLSAVIP